MDSSGFVDTTHGAVLNCDQALELVRKKVASDRAKAIMLEVRRAMQAEKVARNLQAS